MNAEGGIGTVCDVCGAAAAFGLASSRDDTELPRSGRGCGCEAADAAFGVPSSQDAVEPSRGGWFFGNGADSGCEGDGVVVLSVNDAAFELLSTTCASSGGATGSSGSPSPAVSGHHSEVFLGLAEGVAGPLAVEGADVGVSGGSLS